MILYFHNVNRVKKGVIMTEVEKAYLAGFFDGEGCVMISPNCTVKIIVSQKDREVLEWLVREYSGKVYTNGSYCPRWSLFKKETIMRFLKDLRPYLRQKTVEADYAIEMLELSATNSTRPQRKDGRFLPNPNKERRDLLFSLYRAYRDRTSKQSVALRKMLGEKKKLM